MPHDKDITDGGGLEGGIAVRAALVVGAFTIPGAVIIGQWCPKRLGTRGIQWRLDALYREVMAWQAALDHHAESIDRRMRDVEASAVGAENEARMATAQLAELSESLSGQIEQVEHRIELDVISGRYRPSSAMTPRRRPTVGVGARP